MAVFVWATGAIPINTELNATVTASFTVNNRTVATQTFRAILWDHNSFTSTKTLMTQTIVALPANQSVDISMFGLPSDDYELEVRLPSGHMDILGYFITGSDFYRPGAFFRDFSSTENP